MRMLRVERLPACNASRNVHWRTKQRERSQWALLLRAALSPEDRVRAPIEVARGVFTRCSAKEPDSDNLVGSFKVIRDLLQPPSKRNPMGLGLIQGDDPAHLVAEYRWEKAPMRQGSIRVEVSEIIDPESDEMGSQYG